jgi:hypothetical protein
MKYFIFYLQLTQSNYKIVSLVYFRLQQYSYLTCNILIINIFSTSLNQTKFIFKTIAVDSH